MIDDIWNLKLLYYVVRLCALGGVVQSYTLRCRKVDVEGRRLKST